MGLGGASGWLWMMKPGVGSTDRLLAPPDGEFFLQPASPRAHPKRKLAILIPVRAAVGLVILVIGLVVMQVLIGAREEPGRVDPPERAIAVETVVVSSLRVARVTSGFGTARAKSSANLTAEISGPIRHRPEGVDPGEWVERGDLIVEIDSREYRDRLAVSMQRVETIDAQIRGLRVEEESLLESLALAEEAVELTANELRRRESALESGSVNRFEIEVVQRDLTRVRREAEVLRQQAELIPVRRDQLLADLESARANVRLAELDVERTRILAPISGVLQSVNVEEGERIAPGMEVARVVDLRVIEAPIAVGVSDARSIGIGDPVDLMASGAGDGLWSGRVIRQAPEANPATRTLTIFVEVSQEAEGSWADRSGLLLPGQFLRARVQSSSDVERVVVPRSSVVRDRVRLVGEDGRLSTREVEVAYALDRVFPTMHPVVREWLVLSSGLSGGERVVIAGADDLPDGTLVEAMDGVVVKTKSDDGGPG